MRSADSTVRPGGAPGPDLDDTVAFFADRLGFRSSRSGPPTTLGGP
jgi:hypothetical protein